MIALLLHPSCSYMDKYYLFELLSKTTYFFIDFIVTYILIESKVFIKINDIGDLTNLYLIKLNY